MERVFNFSPGPAMIPDAVLQQAQNEMMDYRSSGMSVMELSHRGKQFQAICDQAEADLRTLMNIPDTYAVLFLQGGATQQFSAVPLNLMAHGKADYIDSGNFAHLAAEEARRYGEVHLAASSREEGYARIPDLSRAVFHEDADYVHMTSNNTIYGTRFPTLPNVRVPLVTDASSMILSEEMDVTRFGVIYAGAQKNIGPSGLCVVILRKDLLGRALPCCPKLMNWEIQVKAGSMYNTPNTWGIYLAGLTFQWLLRQGGVAAMEARNVEKASLLYNFLDESRLFRPTAARACRSRMNVTFVTGSAELDAAFIQAAAAQGLVNLKGHRSVGGMRASIYNAMPREGVEKLVAFMKHFELENR